MITGAETGDKLTDLRIRRYHFSDRLRDPAPAVNQPMQDPDAVRIPDVEDIEA